MDMAFAMPMTRDYEWSGPLAQIDSHYRALNMTLVYDIDTKCAIAVPPGTEFKVSRKNRMGLKRIRNVRRLPLSNCLVCT